MRKGIMAKINSFELRRQLFHIFLGVAIVILLFYNLIGENIILVFIIMGLLLSYLSKKTKIPIIYNILEKFERKEEIESFPGKGVIFYFIGSYIVLLLFSKDIAMASIIVLALGDSISHLFGTHF